MLYVLKFNYNLAKLSERITTSIHEGGVLDTSIILDTRSIDLYVPHTVICDEKNNMKTYHTLKILELSNIIEIEEEYQYEEHEWDRALSHKLELDTVESE